MDHVNVVATLTKADAAKLERVLAKAAADDHALAGDVAGRMITGKFLAYALFAGEFERVPDGVKPIAYTTAASR